MKTRLSSSKATQGIALMIVMIVILTLTGVVGVFAYKMKVETRLAQNNNYDSELEWIGRGGIEWARWAVGQQPPPGPSHLNQFWSLGHSPEPDVNSNIKQDINDIFADSSLTDIPFGENAKATVTIADMERKWNINALADPRRAQPLIIQQALNNMGLTDASLASTITESILDWVDPSDNHHFNGAKNDYYLGLDPPYYCKQGFIDDISELLLIKGIRENPEIYYGTAPPNMSAYDIHDPNVFRRGKERPSYPFGLKDVFTTMGGGSMGPDKININTADAAALQMIPEVDERGAQAIIRARADGPIQGGTLDPRNIPGLPPAAQIQTYCAVFSRYFEVTVDAHIGAYSHTYHAVISLTRNPKDPQVVKFYWDYR